MIRGYWKRKKREERKTKKIWSKHQEINCGAWKILENKKAENSFLWIQKTAPRKQFETHVFNWKDNFKGITVGEFILLQKTSSLFLHIWGRWSEVTTKSEHCQRFPRVLSDILPSIKAGKGWSMKLRSYSSSSKTPGGPSQALFIQFLSERVSANRYPERVLEKSWLSFILTVSWTGLNWLSKVTTRNITEKYVAQKKDHSL